MRLSKYNKDDKELYEQLVFNDKVMRQNYGRTFTKAEAELLFSVMLVTNAACTLGYYKVLVPIDNDETYIGMGALNRNEDGVFEIEYMLLPEYWNRGYGTALVQTLLLMAKVSGLSETIEAITDPSNTYSKRILEHTGFVFVKQYNNADGALAELYRKNISDGRKTRNECAKTMKQSSKTPQPR